MKPWGLLVTAVLVAGLFTPVAGAQAGPTPWSQTDPADDIRVNVAGQASPGLPSAAGLDALDVTGLQVDDRDGETLDFIVKTKAPITPTRPTASERYPLGFIRINFKIPGGAVIGEVNIWVYVVIEGGASKPYAWSGYSCVREERDSWCREMKEVTVTGAEGGGLLLSAPKGHFVLDESAPFRTKALPVRLNAGDELTKLQVRASSSYSSSFFAVPGFEDVAPNTGDWPAYRIRFPSSLPNLKLNTTAVGVIAGEESIVEVGLKNLAERKRLINLTGEIEKSEKPGWKVDVTPFVTVSARNETTILLRVLAPSVDAGATKARIRIRASVISEGGDSASLTLEFAASQALDRGSSKYFFHSMDSPSGLMGPVEEHYNQLSGTGGGVSRSETDSRYPDQFGIGFFSWGQSGLRVWGLRTEAFPNPVRVTDGGVVKGRLTLDSPAPIAGKLRLAASLDFNAQPAFTIEKDVSLGAGKTDIDLEGRMLPAVKRLHSGTILWIEVQLRSDSPLAQGFGFYGPRLKLLPKVSWFELPLQRDLEQELVVQGPRVVLAPAEELIDFIAPGRNRIFEMDLRNEEPEEHRVEVAYENVTPGWTVDVLPGARFILKGNDSARIGIRVIAPQNAREEASLAPRIFVRGTESGEVFHSLRINVTVASGIQGLENETFSVAPEDRGKLESLPKGTSPGLSAGLLVVALGLIALGVRRRHGAP